MTASTPDPYPVAHMTLRGLMNLATHDRDAVSSVCIAYLETIGAGHPDVPLFAEKIRSEAALWAASAHPAELEAYVAAATGELERTPLHVKQIKRLAAMIFGRMDGDTKAAFKEWINGQ